MLELRDGIRLLKRVRKFVSNNLHSRYSTRRWVYVLNAQQYDPSNAKKIRRFYDHSKPLRDFMLLASERQLREWGGKIWQFIEREALWFHCAGAWHWHKPLFQMLFGSFFAQGFDDPAFVWITPIWLHAETGIQQHALRSNSSPHYVCFHKAHHSVPLRTGPGNVTLKIPLKNTSEHDALLLGYPWGHDQTAQVVSYVGTRTARLGSRQVELGAVRELLLATDADLESTGDRVIHRERKTPTALPATARSPSASVNTSITLGAIRSDGHTHTTTWTFYPSTGQPTAIMTWHAPFASFLAVRPQFSSLLQKVVFPRPI